MVDFIKLQVSYLAVDGSWNLDIRTENYEDYLRQVNRIGVDLDGLKPI